MTIDIARYINKVQILMGQMLDKAKEDGYVGCVLPKHQKEILLPGAFDAANELAKEIHNEVTLREGEGKSYEPTENELQLLAYAMIWSAWSAWVFKSKSESEDPNRTVADKERAKADSKYVKSMILNAMKGGENVGQRGGTPECRKEAIEIE
jgi:hypothetical protein